MSNQTFEFLVKPFSKFALIRIIVNQFKFLILKICMVFIQEFEFYVQIFIPSILRNSAFEIFQAPLTLGYIKSKCLLNMIFLIFWYVAIILQAKKGKEKKLNSPGVLFCKSILSKMTSTKTNKNKKWAPLPQTNF